MSQMLNSHFTGEFHFHFDESNRQYKQERLLLLTFMIHISCCLESLKII